MTDTYKIICELIRESIHKSESDVDLGSDIFCQNHLGDENDIVDEICQNHLGDENDIRDEIDSCQKHLGDEIDKIDKIDTHVNRLDEVDWADVFSEMKAQRIAGITADVLPGIEMDAQLKKQWRRYIMQQKMFFNELTTAQNEVCRVLESAGISYAVIKGTAAAMYYPDPSQRNMGDIDILFAGGADGDVQAAKDALVAAGYAVNNVGGWRHIGLKKGRIDVELHYRYDKTVVNDVAIAAVKNSEEKCISDGNDRGVSVAGKNGNTGAAGIDAVTGIGAAAGGCRFRTLPKMENGLILLSHAARHLQEGLGFRQVMDWLMFVADPEPMDWERFNELSKAVGLYKFQCALTEILDVKCQNHLGDEIDKIDKIDRIDEFDTRAKLLEFICKRGNFGHREGGYSGQFAMKNKFVYGIKRLQLGGTYRWKALIKYPWLKPFAWIYQSGRVAKEMLSRKDALASLKQDFKDSEDVTLLMQELGLEVSDAKGM